MKKKLEIIAREDGRVEITDREIRRGALVEIFVHIAADAPRSSPLRGLPVRLRDPFLPAVEESEWEAEK